MINKEVIFRDLGFIPYDVCWDYQTKYFQSIIDLKIKSRKEKKEIKTPNYFFFVEHPHVFTLGKNGKIEHLLKSKQELEKKGANFFKTNRGGDITYHGPGQLVGYPILDLENFYTDIHKYLRELEEVIILTLLEYGIKGERSKGETGVWLDSGTPFARKICAMGIKLSRWVSMHGFALNISPNLGYFDFIVPCGIQNKQVTSLEAELNRKISITEVQTKIKTHFLKIFQASEKN